VTLALRRMVWRVLAKPELVVVKVLPMAAMI
jgi:hypothetical protein